MKKRREFKRILIEIQIISAEQTPARWNIPLP
jgi:hypothetical protein